MGFTLLTLSACLLMRDPSGGHVEPAHARNSVYVETLRTGFRDGDATVSFPGPILTDGMDASQQRGALRGLAGSEAALKDLLRDSVTAPYLLKVRDQKTHEATVRILDLWFVVRGDLDRLDALQIAGQSNGKAVEAANMRFESRMLGNEVLKAQGKTTRHERDQSIGYVRLDARILDRIEFQVIDEVVVTRSDGSMVIASRSAATFDAGLKMANRWRTLERGGQPGAWQAYSGGMSYTKISRLKHLEGALLVELHAAFSEPDAWFQGNPILRSKFAPVAQDQVRKLRRELLKERSKSTQPPTGSR